jgi:hypothetical protein
MRNTYQRGKRTGRKSKKKFLGQETISMSKVMWGQNFLDKGETIVISHYVAEVLQPVSVSDDDATHMCV